MNYYIVENIFIEDNILFVANKEASNSLTNFANEIKGFKSFDYPTLWELKDTDGERELYLHIEFPFDLISLKFINKEINKIKENKNKIEILGLLINYDEQTNEAQNVIFIADINEGLHILD